MAIMAQVNTMRAHGAHHAEISRRFAQCALDEFFAEVERALVPQALLVQRKEQ